MEVHAPALSLLCTCAHGRKGATNAAHNPSLRQDPGFSSQCYNLEIMYTLCIINKFELELRLQPALDTQHAHSLSQLDRGRSNRILH